MGNDLKKVKPKKEAVKNPDKNELNPKNSIIEQISCPFCKKVFSSITTIKALNFQKAILF